MRDAATQRFPRAGVESVREARCACPRRDPPDLFVFDVVVPWDCSGVELAHKALRRWPGVKILLTSATPYEFWSDRVRSLFGSLPEGACAFLPKPFTAKQLAAVVDALIGVTAI